MESVQPPRQKDEKQKRSELLILKTSNDRVMIGDYDYEKERWYSHGFLGRTKCPEDIKVVSWDKVEIDLPVSDNSEVPGPSIEDTADENLEELLALLDENDLMYDGIYSGLLLASRIEEKAENYDEFHMLLGHTISIYRRLR